MGDTTIEWTEKTWNPTTGCDKVSPGCAHCYAEQVALRFWRNPPRAFTDVCCHEDRLDQPLRWRLPKKVFVNSMSDLFHEDVPDAFIDKVFAVMALAPQHTFQILTKRAERMRDYVNTEFRANRVFEAMRALTPDRGVWSWPTWSDAMRNVWLGVSVENQRFADERIPLLLQTPAAVRFISAEPLLENVDLHVGRDTLDRWSAAPRIDWVIVGGESGTGARPFDLAWARSIVEQCKAAGVPVFVKQLGANPVIDNDTDERGWPGSTVPLAEHYEPRHQGEIAPLAFISRKGGDPSEWPADLRVRQFPKTSHAQPQRQG